MLKELVIKNRSCRRFLQHKTISAAQLEEWIEIARITPSARNAQPLKYIYSASREMNEKIFPQLAWAGYIKDWDAPEKDEQPAAYIIILRDESIAKKAVEDIGIAAQTILLAATEQNIAGCMIGSINKQKMGKVLELPENLKIELVLALGYPKEEIRLETAKNGDIKYWRDKQGVHHVPKRPIEEVLIRK